MKLTLEQIANMEAGRKMDDIIAETIMGLKLGSDVTTPATMSRMGRIPGLTHQLISPNYSTNIADAWQVIQKLDYKTVEIWWNDSACWWEVRLDPKRRVPEDCRFKAISESDDDKNPYEELPLAICRAALLTTL
jgi:hypothetical protein